jgi:hypothetical protein
LAPVFPPSFFSFCFPVSGFRSQFFVLRFLLSAFRFLFLVAKPLTASNRISIITPVPPPAPNHPELSPPPAARHFRRLHIPTSLDRLPGKHTFLK